MLAFVALRWQLTSGDGGLADLAEGPHKVANVLSGDTLELPGPVEVRLLGIEAIGQCYSVADFKTGADDRSITAIAYTGEFVGSGEIRLQFDRTRLDADGHYLAYVWLDDPARQPPLERRTSPRRPSPPRPKNSRPLLVTDEAPFD